MSTGERDLQFLVQVWGVVAVTVSLSIYRGLHMESIIYNIKPLCILILQAKFNECIQ